MYVLFSFSVSFHLMDQKTGQQFYMHSVSDFFNETFQYFVLPTSQLLHWAVIDQPNNAVNSIIAISCRVSQGGEQGQRIPILKHSVDRVHRIKHFFPLEDHNIQTYSCCRKPILSLSLCVCMCVCLF